MIRKYFKYIGWIKKDQEDNDKKTSYFNSDNSVSKLILERYLNYLKDIENNQKDRRTLIENKNAQLVGQASIVASIFSLFVPLLIGAFNNIELYYSIPLSFIFIFALMHYLSTILHTTNTLKINKYKYANRSTQTITKESRANNEIDFIKEEIKDLIFSINENTPFDNQKGDNLIFGTRCFVIANVTFAILTIVIVFLSFFIRNETQKTKIENFNELKINIPDTILTKMINYKDFDTIYFEIDTNKTKYIIKNNN